MIVSEADEIYDALARFLFAAVRATFLAGAFDPVVLAMLRFRLP